MSDHMEDNQMQRMASDRRAFLGNCGKFAATVPPAMTMLMSTSLVSPAIAQSAGIPDGNGGPGCNNGVGNGSDCAPPGNPPVNDGPGRGPGDPGNQGGGRGRR
ncbi:hypothetical protein FHS61_002294 [Altererythrobacter atlanticus]|uniref:hypothetical protein n=1 Tax=Croceibacterium atlanticum TaxID=1267766 RepID=UPI0009E87529|nr:hypothetical protein [Croceibacterium atlanticum]MBB5733268.1 hypothetical protein [Croceibacterium atlanticum]